MHVPYLPPVAMVLKSQTSFLNCIHKKDHKKKINQLINKLEKDQNFITTVVRGVFDNQYIVTLDMTMEHVI
jgi:hypothetical protein